MQISKRWLAMLLLVLCVLAVRADAAPSAGAGASATTPQESTAYVWSGRSRLADGSVHADALGADLGVRLAKELAEIRVQVDVDRKLEESAERLFDLWIRATRAGYPERQESLVQVLLARSDALAAHGETQAAADALTTVLPATPVAKGYELVPAGEADRALARAVAQDARIVQALSSLSATRATPDPSTEGEDKISQIVGAALVRGDLSLSTSLGERAVPMLVQRVESSLDEFPTIERDPLYHLTIVNGGRAAELVIANHAKGGAIWKARVVRVIRSANLFSDEPSVSPLRTWTNGQSERNAPTYAFPRWFDVLEILITDPSTRREAVGLVSGLPARDALTPGLQRALATILMEPASPYADEIRAMLRFGRGRPTTQALLESVLTSQDPKVREFAAGMLSTFETPVGLREAYRHPDPVVRHAVAESLHSRYVGVAKYPFNSSTEFGRPQIGDKERTILLALAEDSDASVRAEAAASIADLEVPLEKGVYEKLVRDSDTRVRVAVLAAHAVPEEQRAALAMDLASDRDAELLRRFDQVLVEWMKGSKDAPVPEHLLPVLRTRRANGVLGFETLPTQFWYERLGRSEPGLQLLLEWGSAPGGEQPISAFCFALRDIRNRRSPVSIVADGDVWTGAYRTAVALPNTGLYLAMVEYLIDQSHQSVPAFLAVAQDASLDADARLSALAVAANSGATGIEEACLSILGSVSAIEAPRVRFLGHGVAAWIVEPLPEATRTALADELLARESRPSQLIEPLLYQIFQSSAPSIAQSNAILMRFLHPGDTRYDLVTPCLMEVARRPRAEQGEWLSKASCISRYCEKALELIGGLRDPSYVDLLHDILTGKKRFPETSFSDPVPNLRSAALNALTRYFDQRAADIILEVAGSTPDSGFRDECFKALETIRHYEAEKGRVARDRATQQAMTVAVRDLVAMLGDASAEIRVQALRGLATLEAIEQLPAIVRCLKDGDERVRQAAQAALDALNRPPAQK